MDYKTFKNGNIEIDGKQYVPLARLEADIDEAVTYTERKKVITAIAFTAAAIISFAIGYALG